MKLASRFRITASIRFTTAFHLGSGSEGSDFADMGVLTDHTGAPALPGSSLKGVFRANAESLAGHLGMWTCFLEKRHEKCAGASQDLARARLKDLDKAANGIEVEGILSNSLCDVCRLFGSQLARGKLRFHDARIKSWAGALELRDGVGIDRDSGTAVDGVKYDFEVVPAGAVFDFTLDGENLNSIEFALVAATLLEWERGVSLGGMTSRGLGKAILEDLGVRRVDLENPAARLRYLVDGNMQDVPKDDLRAVVRAQVEEAAHA
ncbi:MAG: CRISPR-associated RAMP protein [Deltaproteobacteria bacterium]|nr:CRISPR-associated RAMP protein [Deltaproteobacteria bacterium]